MNDRHIRSLASGLRGVDAAIGGAAGLAGGLLGVGGGFLMVPLQVMWADTPPRRASGNSLAAIVPIAIVGALVYYFGQGTHQLNLTVALFVMVGGSVGAVVGSLLSARVPDRSLRMLVAVLLVVAALKELYDAFLGGSGTLEATTSLDFVPVQYLLLVLSGAVIGILSGLTGVGGGVLVVPLLVVGFGIGQRVAQGTSLLAILPTAAFGAIVHYRQGELDAGASGRMALAGVPAALIGSVLALALPQRILAGLFGLLLLVIAVRMWPTRPEAAES
ncbi:MAG: sulfite exporter TauE/SafE family protein [Candidatus Dormiibacterota bacterium]